MDHIEPGQEFAQDIHQLTEANRKLREENWSLKQKVEELQRLLDAKNDIDEIIKDDSEIARYWRPDEHKRFLEAMRLFGDKNIKAIAQYVKTRSTIQVRTHAQKYFAKMKKMGKSLEFNQNYETRRLTIKNPRLSGSNKTVATSHRTAQDRDGATFQTAPVTHDDVNSATGSGTVGEPSRAAGSQHSRPTRKRTLRTDAAPPIQKCGASDSDVSSTERKRACYPHVKVSGSPVVPELHTAPSTPGRGDAPDGPVYCHTDTDEPKGRPAAAPAPGRASSPSSSSTVTAATTEPCDTASATNSPATSSCNATGSSPVTKTISLASSTFDTAVCMPVPGRRIGHQGAFQAVQRSRKQQTQHHHPCNAAQGDLKELIPRQKQCGAEKRVRVPMVPVTALDCSVVWSTAVSAPAQAACCDYDICGQPLGCYPNVISCNEMLRGHLLARSALMGGPYGLPSGRFLLATPSVPSLTTNTLLDATLQGIMQSSIKSTAAQIMIQQLTARQNDVMQALHH